MTVEFHPLKPRAATRRDFLYIATGAAAAVGTIAALIPMVDQMEPDAASTLAAGGPVELDLGKLQPGQHAVVRWRSRPVFIVNRPAAALKTLQDPKLLARLSDPGSSAPQQPPYADNWHRSVKPGVRRAGLHPHSSRMHPDVLYRDQETASRRPTGWAAISVPVTARNTIWPAAVFSGVPAPYNLPVPPYRLVGGTTIRIGENPPDVVWDFSSIAQI